MAQQQRNPLQSIGNTLRSRKNLDHQPEQGRKRTNQNSNLNEQENKPDGLDLPFQKKAKSDNNYQPTNQYNTRSVTEQKESKNGKLSQCEASSLPAKSKRKKNAILKEVSIVLGCSDELEEGCSEQESEETTLQEQIEKWLREREKEYAANPDYLKWQPNITAKMRAILLEWMMEVAEEYELHRETMGMAINYVDRFLSIHPKISKESFQLVGIGALFIAAKLEEYDILQPGVLVSVTDNAYPAESLLQMERLMANSFQWNLLPPTPYLWLKLFMQRISRIKKTEFPKTDFSRGMQFIDICSLDVKYVKFLPSALAASVFYKFFLPPKGILFSEITGFEIEELSECLEWTNTFGPLPRNPDPRLTKMDSFEFQFKTTGFDTVVQKFRQQDPNAMSD